MKKDSVVLIQEALEVLGLPTFINLKELKQRYRLMVRENHPDFGGSQESIMAINEAYNFLKSYMVNFRFSFSKEEIYKQYPQDEYVNKFKF